MLLFQVPIIFVCYMTKHTCTVAFGNQAKETKNFSFQLRFPPAATTIEAAILTWEGGKTRQH